MGPARCSVQGKGYFLGSERKWGGEGPRDTEEVETGQRGKESQHRCLLVRVLQRNKIEKIASY